MQITIDLDLLNKLGITPNQYCILFLKYQKVDFQCNSDDLIKLELKGFIKINGDDYKDYVLREQGLRLFESTTDDQKFNEIWGNYPLKVPDGKGGYRILRAKSVDTEDGKTCKKKYLTIIKNKPGLHERIMKALDSQLATMRGRLQYLQQFEVWLNNKTYEKYLDTDHHEDKKNSGYGQKLI